MSRQIHLGPLHAAVIGNRRQRRLVVRVWRGEDAARSGRWAVFSLAPLRLRTGREVLSQELV